MTCRTSPGNQVTMSSAMNASVPSISTANAWGETGAGHATGLLVSGTRLGEPPAQRAEAIVLGHTGLPGDDQPAARWPRGRAGLCASSRGPAPDHDQQAGQPQPAPILVAVEGHAHWPTNGAIVPQGVRTGRQLLTRRRQE